MSDDFSGALVEAVRRQRGGVGEGDADYEKYKKIWTQHSASSAISLFRNSAQSIIEEISQSSKFDSQMASEDYVIYFGDREYRFPAKRQLILVGRRSLCDIKIGMNLPTTSRIAVMFYLCPESSEIALVDPNGLYGWKMISRSDSKADLLSSTENKRRSLILLDWNEGFVFELGSAKIICQPRTCFICENRRREVILPCGHFLMCIECSQKVSKCPEGCKEEESGKATKRHVYDEWDSYVPSKKQKM